MKRVIVIMLVILMVSMPCFAGRITRDINPVVKQETYTSAQTNTAIWTPDSLKSIVVTGYTISSADEQEITLAASDSLVTVQVSASDPVISPAGFLWRGSANEVINVTTAGGRVSITINGWEEQ